MPRSSSARLRRQRQKSHHPRQKSSLHRIFRSESLEWCALNNKNVPVCCAVVAAHGPSIAFAQTHRRMEQRVPNAEHISRGRLLRSARSASSHFINPARGGGI